MKEHSLHIFKYFEMFSLPPSCTFKEFLSLFFYKTKESSFKTFNVAFKEGLRNVLGRAE